MAKTGRKIIDAEGFGLIFRKTAADTGGELLEMEAFYRPQSEMPPPHYHPAQEEEFEVYSGVFQVRLGDEERAYRTGERFTIPAGQAHAMCNISAEKGHLLWQTRPAYNSEGFFETLWSMERKRGLGQLLRLAVVFKTYEKEVRLSSPVQRVLLKVLAVFARLSGITAGSLLPRETVATE
jgi:quercetin dioxygenase-like cupin family protein